MNINSILAVVCLTASLAQAAPSLPDQVRLRTVMRPAYELDLSVSSIFNPRFFDGKVYVNQINVPCFGRYPIGLDAPEMLVNNNGNSFAEHRMVAPFPGALSNSYILASGSALASSTIFTRYDYDGFNPVPVEAPDSMTIDAFDWVDDDTIIYAIYTSGNRKKLCLADVTAEPFAVTKNTSWNDNGFVTTSVSARIRNVRKGDVYSGYVYYGDAGQNTDPKFYALNLATGTETLLGNLGALTGSGSFGVWTVLERGGYLFVQTTDNGIWIYNLANATTLGSLYGTYTKAQLDALTGSTTQYYGLDVTPDGKKFVLGDGAGKAFLIDTRGVPYVAAQLQKFNTVQPSTELSVAGGSMFNPRFFDGKIYANQITTPLFARYASGTNAAEMLVNNTSDPSMEHRMVAPFRGKLRSTYILGSSSGATASTIFALYDSTGYGPTTADVPDTLTAGAFDWVDEDTIIYTVYTSGNRKKLCLADVTASPFTLTKNTTWNTDGFVTTSVSTRIRNVRTGDLYSGYAYYGDAGQNTDPKFYAINLATGAETLLGNLGTLTGSGSYGIWTVLERDGYLYVQTTDNGIQVYAMADATTLGPLYATYTKPQLDALTGDSSQYYGLDVTSDGSKLLLAGINGKVYELNGHAITTPPTLTITRSGSNIVLSWPASASPTVLQSTPLLTTTFADVDPQPSVVVNGDQNTITLPAGGSPAFYRLRQ